MLRPLLLLIAVASLGFGAPAAAQDEAGPTGRYRLNPGEDGGFVRLDTRTGAISHCGQRDGVWFCEPFADNGKDRTAALADEVARLSERLDRLAQLAGVDARMTTVREERAAGPGFADTVMRRFMDMVRTLKHEASGET